MLLHFQLTTCRACIASFSSYFSGHTTELAPCIFRLHVSKVSPKRFEPFGEKAKYIVIHAVVALCMY